MDPLWITYAWKDDEGGDFSYLVQELEAVGVSVRYDRNTLVPGRPLWGQIAEQITTSPLSAWASLLTPNSLLRPGCQEELAYALDRAMRTKGRGFPLIGLLHNVSIEDVPPTLRIRLCVNLDDPQWREQVLAGVQGRPPGHKAKPQGPYVVRTHRNYLGRGCTAVEAGPRFGNIMRWRFAVPKGTKVAASGVGPSDGGAVSATHREMVNGISMRFKGVDCVAYGSADPISASMSGYLVNRRLASRVRRDRQGTRHARRPGGLCCVSPCPTSS